MRVFRFLLPFRASSQLRGAAPPSVEEWPIRRLTVTTPGLPETPFGCSFRTAVVDTKASDHDAPAILVLHDVPGSHRDLGALIRSFQRLDARVIAVNLPGNQFCRGVTAADDTSFSYSSSDIATFTDTVLANLGVRRLNGLVTSGYSYLPALHLINAVSHLYPAACFLNPPPLPAPSPIPSFLFSSFPTLWSSSSFSRGLSRLYLRTISINNRLTRPVGSTDEAAATILIYRGCSSREERTSLIELAAEPPARPLLIISSSEGRQAVDQLIGPFAEGIEVGQLEARTVDGVWDLWSRLEADCSPDQLIRESFFTDKIAAIFLKRFAGDKRNRKLQAA